jgi:hypothetical protein
MGKSDDLLASLPGSRRHDGGDKTVSNYTLMPTLSKLPGASSPEAKDAKPPPVHTLGSGGAIPKGHDSRMLSQFSVSDPLTYGTKKPEPEERSSDDESDHWVSRDVRLSVPCSPYKSKSKPKTAGGPGVTSSMESGGAYEAQSSDAVMEKAKKVAEQRKLEGEKQFFLRQLSTDKSIKFGDTRMSAILGHVAQINQKLGLPVSHIGAWKLPDRD